MRKRNSTPKENLLIFCAMGAPIIALILLVTCILMLHRMGKKLEIIQNQTQMVQKEEPKEEESNCPAFCKNNNGAICRNMGCY